MATRMFRRRSGGPQRQRGVVLAVALVLLLIITLLGLAAVRGTNMQQHMAANMYDREQSFQAAEAAIRSATALLPSTPSLIARDCQAGGVSCPTNPFSDSALPSTAIHTVSSGSATGQFTASDLAAGQPQYVVENMGNWTDTESDTGFNQTANSHNYGAQGLSTTAVYYRITARSADPATAGNRAIVTIQATVKKL